MDDFNQVSDPAAEFLAREQNELGELGDELRYRNESEGLNGDINDENGSAPNSTDIYSSVRSEHMIQSEPEKIKIWRQEFMSRIERKDEVEAEKKESMEAAAKKELMDWRRHYQEQMIKSHALNREQDASVLADRDQKSEASANQHIWERVCRLCEFNPPKSSTTGVSAGKVAVGSGGTVLSGSKDVSRMRSVLLQLKQQPLVR